MSNVGNTLRFLDGFCTTAPSKSHATYSFCQLEAWEKRVGIEGDPIKRVIWVCDKYRVRRLIVPLMRFFRENKRNDNNTRSTEQTVNMQLASGVMDKHNHKKQNSYLMRHSVRFSGGKCLHVHTTFGIITFPGIKQMKKYRPMYSKLIS